MANHTTNNYLVPARVATTHKFRNGSFLKHIIGNKHIHTQSSVQPGDSEVTEYEGAVLHTTQTEDGDSSAGASTTVGHVETVSAGRHCQAYASGQVVKTEVDGVRARASAKGHQPNVVIRTANVEAFAEGGSDDEFIVEVAINSDKGGITNAAKRFIMACPGNAIKRIKAAFTSESGSSTDAESETRSDAQLQNNNENEQIPATAESGPPHDITCALQPYQPALNIAKDVGLMNLSLDLKPALI